jgi:hypothetical protein
MNWLLYSIVAACSVQAVKKQQYGELKEKINFSYESNMNMNRRFLIQNIFELQESDLAFTKEKHLGFGQGSNRQGLKRGMNTDSEIDEGMTQSKGMGNMGGAAKMGKMGDTGAMAKMGNRTMNMMAMSTSTFLLFLFEKNTSD